MEGSSGEVDQSTMGDDHRFADLVFEGGGVKGIGLAGAYAALEGRGFAHKGVAGTSAGAIAAALIAAGYSSKELGQILIDLPFADFKDEGWEDRLPVIGKPLRLLRKHGIYRGDFFREWMAEKLKARGITTFGQLVDEEAEVSENRWRLKVIASDVSCRRMLVLPQDAPHLGIEPDEMEIADAVRMSMSIPGFFEPVVHKDRSGKRHVIVDGGLLSNFPVWLFDRQGRDPRWPTFGLRLVEPEPRKPIGHRLRGEDYGARRGSLLEYFKALAQTSMEAHDRLYLEKATFARTIPIPTLGVGTTEFEITPERVDALYDSGHMAASDFLDRWDFEAYIEEFRRGKQHRRREDMLPTEPGSE
jgi:NTE family protein